MGLGLVVRVYFRFDSFADNCLGWKMSSRSLSFLRFELALGLGLKLGSGLRLGLGLEYSLA